MEGKKMGYKNRKLPIILVVLVFVILLLIAYMIVFQSKSRITINEDEIEYIMLYGFDVQIGNELLSGEIDKRLDSGSAKRKIVNYMNNLDKLENYRQGDPIIGTPSFQIKIFLYDGGMVTIEDGGIIVVRNNNSEKWYDANDSFHELFYKMYME